MILTIIIRSLIIYFIVLILLRIMGKRQIGEMQPFELVITLIIADLATVPMSETALPLLHGIIPLLTLCVLNYFLSFISRKSWFMRRLINGKPVIVIGPNGIDYTALKMLNMSFSDLQESLRKSGYFNIEEVLYAIVQTNGTVSILPRSKFAPATPSDLKINVGDASLPIIVVSEGKLMKENLTIAKIDQNFLENEMQLAGGQKLSKLLLVTLNQDGQMYIQPKKGAFITHNAQYKGKGLW